MIGTKLCFLLSVFTIAKSDLSTKLKLQKYLKENSVAKATVLNERSFRLPNNTEPVSYNIYLTTDIHRGHFDFQGEVSINIRALETTNSITLHSRNTIIERIDLFNPNGTLFQEDLHFTYDSELNFLVIPVNRGLEAGQEFTIEISYQGFLHTQSGFFRTSYFDPETNQETWVAGAQFSPIHARHAFPCYDELQYRRPIVLQIRHHQSYNAISNMPVAKLTADGEYVITAFEETPPIQTRTLAFTVSNFDFVENTDSTTNVDFRVYARPEAIRLGQANDSLRLGESLLRAMVELYEIPYSLPKSDQVAMPSFSFLGIENWGLITHLENVLLQFNNDPVAQRFREIRIAHEYSHIYFSNLVAPSSWAYVWQNEGLATHYENALLGFILPGFDGWQIFLMEYFDVSITLDVMGLLPPLNLYAESPQEITAKFNFESYYKSAIILRMFGEAIGPFTFVKGMRHYLLTFQMGISSPEDFYNGVQVGYDEDFPGGGLNLTELMSPWFDFEGYPVVTVRRSDEGLTLTQEGFRTLHDQLFSIPITYATASHPNFAVSQADFWMTTSQFEISRDDAPKNWTDDDWIIVNVRDSAYYITNYDDNLWNLIINALNNDHEAIHFLNRGTLFADFHRFIAQDFNITITWFFRMMESLPLELEPHVWNRAALGLTIAEVRLRGTEFHSSHMNFIQGIMSQIYGIRSFNDRSAMNLINEWSCLSGVQQCMDDALNVLIEVMDTGSTDYEFDYQCNGLRAANQSIWMDFYVSVVDSDSTDRSDALRDLMCTENYDLIRFYLNQVFNATNNLLPTEREIILLTAAVQHEISSYVLLDIIELNDEAINEITSISNLILELVTITNNYIQSETVRSLLQFVTDDILTEEFLNQLIQPNLNFVYRNENALRQWFYEPNLSDK